MTAIAATTAMIKMLAAAAATTRATRRLDVSQVLPSSILKGIWNAKDEENLALLQELYQEVEDRIEGIA